MFWSWKHAILTHYGLHSAYGVNELRTSIFQPNRSVVNLSFSRDLCNLAEGPTWGNNGLSDKSDLGLLS